MSGSCADSWIRRTSALPTITPSATAATRAASSGVATPNPTAIGTVDRLRRLDLATGLIRHVAGAAGACSSDNGDGGPAELARLCNLISHASAPDGSIYLLDRGGARYTITAVFPMEGGELQILIAAGAAPFELTP